MRSNAGMANRQGDVDLREAQDSAPQFTLRLGLVWLLQSHFIHLPMKIEQIVFRNVGI